MLSDATHEPDDVEIPINKIRRQNSNDVSNDGCAVQEQESSSQLNDEPATAASDECAPFTQERVTLEALENTKVAVAQFAAIALAKGGDVNAIKDLSLLQSTLFTLQHQQVVQLQLIQKLQSQLDSTNKKDFFSKKSTSSSLVKSVDGTKDITNKKSVNPMQMLPSPPPPPPPPPPPLLPLALPPMTKTMSTVNQQENG